MFGPAIDLLLGCGGGYLVLAGGMALLPVGPSSLLRWGVLATFVTGMPHYGATLLRVYENRSERRRYVLFSLWASLAIWAGFVAGVYHSLAGALLVTLYITWSPWHYAGQNYGLAVLFLRRRGVPPATRVKRPLYASFILSYALAFLSLHGGYEAAGYVPFDVTNPSYRILSLGIPRAAYQLLFPALFLAYLAALARMGWQLRGHARAALPAGLLVLTQALWFTVPSVALWASGAMVRDDHVFFYFLWVGIAHAVQYLWVTTYYAAGSEDAPARLRYIAKTLLAGGLTFAVPALCFAPGLLGRVPYETGLWLLIAAAVNLQHFVLDGAIWKLRDGRVSRILLAAPVASGSPLAHDPIARPWLRRGVWGLAAACTVIAIGAAWEYEIGWIAATERGDQERASLAERRLAAIGRDNPLFYERRAREHLRHGEVGAAIAEYERSLAFYPTYEAWYALGAQRAAQGDSSGALEAFESSLGIRPSPEAWTGIGAVREMEGEDEAAARAYQEALGLDPRYVPALQLAGRHWLGRGRKDLARSLLERAAALAPGDAQLRADLRRAGG